MEKLNLVKILKDCPKGTKLYSPALGECALEGVNDNNDYPIKVTYKIINNDTRFDYFTKYGYLLINKPDAECMLFPSKDQRDWSKWHRPFVDGDIVFYNDTIAIFKEWGDETLFRTYVTKYLCCDSLIDINTPLFGKGIRKEIRFATEKEKETLFQAIKSLGYKWNTETKTLEPLIVPKFKVGDSVQSKTDNNDKFTITNIDNNQFYYGCGNNHEFMIPVIKQDNWELVPNKFDISTLIPYESKVLIRNTIGGYWQPSFWGAYIIDHSDGLHHHDYLTTKGFTHYCIPYDGNEHLIGTTDDCCDFYKTWKE